MAAEASSKSTSSADSYIGSLISLTSKSEMRYEGILYNINTEESSIGLRNVRSFGTEGRKKDGPQVPPSDKVYEYILFRGTDIKDLQVKSSAPVPAPPSINNDPAIIQSHYPRPVSTTTSLPSAASASLPDMSSHAPQLGHPGSTFPGGLPLYQPGGNIGSWGPSPPPISGNGGGLPMPMYWQGFYAPPPNGLPHLHQQSLLRPPPGLSMPLPIQQQQQPMQYPGFNPALPTSALNLPVSNLPELPSSLLPSGLGPLNLSSTSLPLSTLPSTLPAVPSSTLASDSFSSVMQNKVPNPVLPTAPLTSTLPSFSSLATSNPDPNITIPPLLNKPNPVPGQGLPYQIPSQSISSIVGISSSSTTDTPTPSLVTPGQLLQSGPSTITSSHSSQIAHKDVEVVKVSSSPSLPEQPVTLPTEVQPPILPLPVPAPSRAGSQKLNGAPLHNRHVYRGRERGRGTGSSRPVTRFTEDFDFIGMNEKFNKDEVWGHLGKTNKSQSKDKEEDIGITDEDDSEAEDDSELSKSGNTSTYNKDDFFDSLSCNALDHHSHNGRTRFSEQMKIDTETFGDFPRYRGGRGGRGPGRGGGGRFRGAYYGRGYGYVGRGRGRGRAPMGYEP